MVKKKRENPHQGILFEAPTREGPQVTYMRVPQRVSLEEALGSVDNNAVMGVDSETTGLDPHKNRMRLLQLAPENEPVILLDLFALTDSREWKCLENFFCQERHLVFQNARFDLQFLAKYGIFPKGTLFDTMIAAQILDQGLEKRSHSLASLAERYLGEFLPKEMRQSDWNAPELTSSQLLYAARDAAILLPLREVLISQIRERNLVSIAKIEFHCIPPVAAMEYRGIALEKALFSKLRTTLEEEKEQTEAKLLEALHQGVSPTASRQKSLFDDPFRINLESPKQVTQALRWQGIPVQTTSRKELDNLASQYETVRLLLEYRRAAKGVQSFGKSMEKFIHPVTGRLHPRYGQLQTPTGRFTCSSPNVQQIPREGRFRRCFEAPSGRVLVMGDYSQIELRVAAEISGDERMIRAYREGQDLHLLTAALLTGKAFEKVTPQERQLAKAINFGLIYAMGARGLQSYAQSTFHIPMSYQEARDFRKRFFQAYPGIAGWHEKERVSPPGERRTLGGRPYNTGPHGSLPYRLNTPVQGSAADMLKLAMGLFFDGLSKEQEFIVGCVHDELVAECDEYRGPHLAKAMKEAMEEGGKKLLHQVPVEAKVSVGKSWEEKQ